MAQRKPLVWIGGRRRQLPTGDTLAGAEPPVEPGDAQQYYRGDKTWQTLATAVRSVVLTGLSTATNAAITATDTILQALGKLQAQINVREPTIAPGLASQYWRGDKAWATLNKASVGLSNVDNTSDAEKPISTPVQSALDAKAALAGANFSGPITFPHGSKIIGTANGVANICSFLFYDADATTRRGFLGDAASANSDIYVGSDTGNVVLWVQGTVRVNAHTGGAGVTGALSVTGVVGAATNSTFGNTLIASDKIEINQNGTGDRNAYMDLHADDTNTDYSARIYRYAGVNGACGFHSYGTAGISINSVGGAVSLTYANSTKLATTSTGIDVTGIVNSYGLSPLVTVSATSKTFALADAGTYQRFTSGSATTCTVPTNASVAYPIGSEIHIRRAANANLTIVASSGVTINAPSGGTLVLTNNMTCTLKKVATDTWDLIGQTVAA